MGYMEIKVKLSWSPYYKHKIYTKPIEELTMDNQENPIIEEAKIPIDEVKEYVKPKDAKKVLKAEQDYIKPQNFEADKKLLKAD